MMERVCKWYSGVSLGLVIRLLILPVALSVIDFSMTLLYQPVEFWEGDRTALLEVNPIARFVLMLHPLLIIPVMLTWYILMFPLIFKTPARFGLRVVAAHILGCVTVISGWLIRMNDDGLFWVAFLVIVVSFLSFSVLRPFGGQWDSSLPVCR